MIEGNKIVISGDMNKLIESVERVAEGRNQVIDIAYMQDLGMILKQIQNGFNYHNSVVLVKRDCVVFGKTTSSGGK